MTACSELERLIVARPLRALEGADEQALDAHVASCARCAALEADAREAAAELDLPPGVARDGWAALAERIDADRKRRGVRVAVGCAYCKDVLAREEAVYCAACLAPQHRDCFAEHGRCSAPGCGETRFVESRLGGAPRPRPKRRLARIAAIVALAAGVGTAAALAPRSRGHIHVALAPGVASSASETRIDVDASNAKVHDLVTQIALVTEKNVVVLKDPPALVSLDMKAARLPDVLDEIARLADCSVQRRGSILCLVHEPRLAITFDDTDVREAVRDLAARGDVTVSIAPEVSGTISCDLHNIHWRKALIKIVQTVGEFEVVEETADFLRVIPRSAIQKEQRITIILELKYRRGAAAADLKGLIDIAIHQGGTLEGIVVDLDAKTSSLVATGTAAKLEVLRRWVAQYDVPTASAEAGAPSFYGTAFHSENSTVFYVIDISGSMGWDMGQYTAPDGKASTGCRIDRAKAEVVKSIVGLPRDWRFSVMAYDCGNYLWQSSLQPADDAHKQSAMAWVQQLQPQGATGTGPAVVAALAAADVKHVVLLTDGAPNCGAGDSSGSVACCDSHRKLIAAANKQHAAIDVFGIGATGDMKEFCLGVAGDSGGIYVDVK